MSDDRLCTIWNAFIFRGPRRGEMCALSWPEVSLDGSWFRISAYPHIRISAQIVEIAYRQFNEAPKQDSVCTVTLDSQTRELWREWQATQAREHEQWSGEEAWVESNRVWTRENGEPLHPDRISRRFNRLVGLSGPPRLHDTRHLPATLALLGKADIKVVQEWLGHSSRQITSDTYTSVLRQLLTAEAESTIAVVPRTEQKGSGRDKRCKEKEQVQAAETEPAAENEGPDEGLRPAA
ncbi:tyrosine-type recombinase/integrase [Streptomyces graminofaciens]|uniref:tyrosine-type recombinase/integrase n=1 Tax=Streptomyces graminofaciens TaxID=68212 RepID=UPI0025726F86|nr:tyrosine-type recombinase/integrase [Streptomyces graminofaciens]